MCVYNKSIIYFKTESRSPRATENDLYVMFAKTTVAIFPPSRRAEKIAAINNVAFFKVAGSPIHHPWISLPLLRKKCNSH